MRAQAFDFSFSLQLHREKKQQREFCALFKEELDREEDKVKRRRRTYVCLNVWVNSSYPSRALGGFCVLKRRNFEFERLVFLLQAKKGKKTNQFCLRLKRTHKSCRKERWKERFEACVLFLFLRTKTHFDASGFGHTFCASSSFFSPQHIKAPTLCARRKITINIHTERGLRKERTFHDARNTTTVTRSRERLVSSFDFR